mgnify:CR=1 FL=1
MSDSILWNPEPRAAYLVNGKLVDASGLPNPIENRGFRFADGFFETIRVAHGKAQHVSLHFNRVINSLQAHRIEEPSDFNLESFSAALDQLIASNKLHQGGRIRASFIRDGGGRYTPRSNDLLWIAEGELLDQNEFIINEKGLAVDLFAEMRKPASPLANFKNIAASLYVQASIWAQKNGLDDALISNEQFNVIESSRSNIFLVSNGVLYTSDLDGGPVGGVMRAAIINVALANQYKVYECNLTPQELLRADELFLTNAIMGIQWVSSYRTKRYYNKTAKELTQLINANLLH